MKIEDIAKMANVSKTAVSFALNSKPGVSPETKERILRIVRETGYVHRTAVNSAHRKQPNRSLRFVAFTNSGIVLDQYEQQPFFTELIRNVEEACSSYGYALLFSSIQGNDLSSEIDKIESEHASSGIVLLGTNLNKDQILSISSRVPNLVVIDTYFDELNVDFVVMNNAMGSHQAAMHLIKQGHRRIGYVQSRTRMHNFDARKRGFYAALEEHSLQIEEEHLFTIAPTTVTAQEEFKQRLAALSGNLPSALFCECDYMAISVIKSLTEMGIRVPGEVAVIGFDDIAEARIITPELTTIHVEKDTIAAVAVDRLMKKIEQQQTDAAAPDITIKSMISTRLVQRQSS